MRRASRWRWSLLFIFLLYFSAPAYAAFSKLEVYTNIIGRDLDDIRPWLFTWGELGLIQICGKNAPSLQAVIDACKAIPDHPGVVRFQDFVINTDVIVLSTPEIAGLPYVISGLVAAGGLAAALSTADGLLLAIANALSHDIYYKMIQPLRPAGRVDRHRRHPGGDRRCRVTGSCRARWPLRDRDALVGAGPRLHSSRSLSMPFWFGMNDVTKRLTVARVLLLYVAATLGGAGLDQAVGHSGHGGLGVLAGHGRQLPGHHHGHLVEADDDGRLPSAASSPVGRCACSTWSPRGTSRSSA